MSNHDELIERLRASAAGKQRFSKHSNSEELA